jgi:hypothetical protein
MRVKRKRQPAPRAVPGGSGANPATAAVAAASAAWLADAPQALADPSSAPPSAAAEARVPERGAACEACRGLVSCRRPIPFDCKAHSWYLLLRASRSDAEERRIRLCGICGRCRDPPPKAGGLPPAAHVDTSETEPAESRLRREWHVSMLNECWIALRAGILNDVVLIDDSFVVFVHQRIDSRVYMAFCLQSPTSRMHTSMPYPTFRVVGKLHAWDRRAGRDSHEMPPEPGITSLLGAQIAVSVRTFHEQLFARAGKAMPKQSMDHFGDIGVRFVSVFQKEVPLLALPRADIRCLALLPAPPPSAPATRRAQPRASSFAASAAPNRRRRRLVWDRDNGGPQGQLLSVFTRTADEVRARLLARLVCGSFCLWANGGSHTRSVDAATDRDAPSAMRALERTVPPALGRLTAGTVNECLAHLLAMPVDSPEELRYLASAVLAEAVAAPERCPPLADLCVRLQQTLRSFPTAAGQGRHSFARFLLNLCQSQVEGPDVFCDQQPDADRKLDVRDKRKPPPLIGT